MTKKINKLISSTKNKNGHGKMVLGINNIFRKCNRVSKQSQKLVLQRKKKEIKMKFK